MSPKMVSNRSYRVLCAMFSPTSDPMVAPSIQIRVDGCSAQLPRNEEVPFLERTQHRLVLRFHFPNRVQRDLPAVLQIHLELPPYRLGKAAAVHHHVAFGVVEARARGHIEGTYRSHHVVDDQVLRVEGSRPLPLE